MKALICKLIQWHDCFFSFCEKYLTAILLLAFRIHTGCVFFDSGLSKITTWSTTLYLFQYEYQVPLVPYQFAAYSSTAVELGASVLIFLGLFTRIATIPLMVLVLVIQYTFEMNIMHLYWLALIFVIMFYGPGLISIDAFLTKIFKNPKKC